MGLVIAGPALSQSEPDSPALELGISTGIQANTNRALDAADPGSTTELFTRLDFLYRFATPIQTFDISGDIGLRTASGAEASDLPDGVFDPTLRLSYTRRARDAQLDTSAFYLERDVSASELQFDPVTADFDLLDSTGTQRQFGFDAALELRRRAPFGITLSAGATAIRFSDTDDPDLTDEDRFRAGLRLRFDLNPVSQAIVGARFSTFEDLGDTEGRRDTLSLDGTLRRQLTNGALSLRAAVTDTEDGTRYTLSTGRSVETAQWQVSGTVGLTREVDGDVSLVGGVDIAGDLPNGSLTFGFDQSVRSGADDAEENVTSINMGYSRALSALTQFDASLSFSDRSAAAEDDDGRFTSVSLGISHQLSRDWRLSLNLVHRISDTTSDGRTDDSMLQLSVRRNLLARR